MSESKELKRELKEIPLDKILIDPGQPRQDFDEEGIEALAGSIKKEGLLHPIILKPSSRYRSDKTYVIVSGERRFRAFIFLKEKTIPAIVIPEGDTFALSLVENIVRQDLNPIEEAKAFKKLVEEKNYSQREVGDLIGRSQTHVSQRLLLLRLPEEIQELVVKGKLPAVTALNFSPYAKEKRKIIQLAHDLISTRIPIRQAESIIQAILGKKEEEINPELLQAERDSLWKKDEQIISARTNYLDCRGRVRRTIFSLQQVINLPAEKRKICLNSVNEESRINLLLRLMELINTVKALFEVEAEMSGSDSLLKFYKERVGSIMVEIEKGEAETKKTEKEKDQEFDGVINADEWLKPIWEMLLHPAGPSLNLETLRERTEIKEERMLLACLNGGIKVLLEIWDKDNDGYGREALNFRNMVKTRWPSKDLFKILSSLKVQVKEEECVKLNIFENS